MTQPGVWGVRHRHTWVRRVGFVALVVVFVALASLAAGARASAVPRSGVTVRVTPPSSTFDAPLMISVHGLRPAEEATLRATSTDGHGVEWASTATFVADGHGMIVPARVAPKAGSYSGVRAMGLIDSMSPTNPGSGPAYVWIGARPFTVSVSTRRGRPVAATVVRSISNPGVSEVAETLAGAGFIGQLWEPAPGTARQPAVLEFGGSEGGLDGALVGAALASRGYPTLDLAYFGESGLPPTLSNIPLEYFANALIWLGQQPNVDPHHMYVLSASRGSEAALLLGVHYPSLVAGVIASVPSNVTQCAYPGCGGPAWTLSGQAVPYTNQFDQAAPTDNPAAIIPVERIAGPILLDCAGHDAVSTSCDYAKAIITRLANHRTTQPHLLLSYPNAGHGIASLVPYEPSAKGAPGAPAGLAGATPGANPAAVANLWPRVLAFIANPAGAS